MDLYDKGYEIADHTKSHKSIKARPPLLAHSRGSFHGAARPPGRPAGWFWQALCGSRPGLCGCTQGAPLHAPDAPWPPPPPVLTGGQGIGEEKVAKEIQGGKDTLTNCGVPAEDIVGLRVRLLQGAMLPEPAARCGGWGLGAAAGRLPAAACRPAAAAPCCSGSPRPRADHTAKLLCPLRRRRS